MERRLFVCSAGRFPVGESWRRQRAPDAGPPRCLSPAAVRRAPHRELVAASAGAQARQIEYLLAENRVLRARLGLRRSGLPIPSVACSAEKGRAVGRKLLEGLSVLATPDTIVRWYRDLIAAKYDGSERRRGPGRLRAAATAVSQLLAMARENPTWGYTRLRGALSTVGYELGRSTIQRVLAEDGLAKSECLAKVIPLGEAHP